MSDPSTAITDVLAAHQYGMDTQCDCGQDFPNAVTFADIDRMLAAHQAAMLAPVIREREAAAWEKGKAAESEDSSHWDGYRMDPGYTEHANPYRADQLEES